MKKNITRVIAFVAGLYFLLEFMLPAGIAFNKTPNPQAPDTQTSAKVYIVKNEKAEILENPDVNVVEKSAFKITTDDKTVFLNPFTPSFGNVSTFLLVLAAMALYLGPINLTRSELNQILRRRQGRMESVVYMVALIIGIVATASRDTVVGPPDYTSFQGVMTVTYNAIFYGVNLAFYITSMGLVSFYLVSAAHRAFLLNNLESGVMMVSASIVMIGLTPVGDVLNRMLPDWLQLGIMSQWILTCPNTAVQKAVVFGACGGAFVAAMRNWLSLGQREE
ncbi:hypothetical protein ACFL34_01310 [Candidatus Sumerlaeota bacterium]